MESLRKGGALPAMIIVCALLVNAYVASAQTLPSGWTSQDINSTGGSANSNSGTWSVSGSGANIWDAADAFQFTSRLTTGDFAFTARLTAFDVSNEWSKAGLMVRESLSANARNAYAMFSTGTGPSLQYRATSGGTTTRVTGDGGSALPWLRLVRQGTRFTAYSSTDGSSWTTIGSTTLSLASTVYVGLAVTSRDVAAISTATFTNVTIAAGATLTPTSDWSSVDIGSPTLAGSFSLSSGTFSISGSGADIWGATDQFRYVYQPVSGDVEIIARVASFDAVAWWSKVGVMIRQSLDARAPHAFMLLSGSNGFAFQRRLTAGGASSSTQGELVAAPAWVRLVREGNLITAYGSVDGTAWELVGSDTIAMSGTVLVGLAITSQTLIETASATLTNVSVRMPSLGANQSPTVTLTAPTAGASYGAPATVSLSASASDSDGTISRVDFYRGSTLIASDTTSPYSATWSSAPTGSYSLTAVAYDNEGATTTSPAVNITVGAGSTNQPPTVSFVSPSAGATLTAPAEIYIEVAASDPDGTISRVDLYRGSTLLKSDRTIPYSYRLTNVSAGTYQLTATAYDSSGQSRTVTVSVTVNPAGNQAPSVSITSPSNGAAFTALATVSVQASASDSDGTISRVEFYRGTTLIATDTTSPYSASWSSAPAGSYSLTARAYDNGGASRTSAAVAITVGSSNQLPTVSITSPTSAASFLAPATITIAATATDPNGTISGVDFYVGTQLIGTDTTSPYTASWTNVAAGSYSLTARARDNAGASTTSTAVSVTVSPATTTATRLVFTASVDHATVTSYVVALYRSVDPTTASPVGTRDVGKPTPVNGDITADISTLVNPLPSGGYYAVVRAINSSGASVSSPSPTFTK